MSDEESSEEEQDQGEESDEQEVIAKNKKNGGAAGGKGKAAAPTKKPAAAAEEEEEDDDEDDEEDDEEDENPKKRKAAEQGQGGKTKKGGEKKTQDNGDGHAVIQILGFPYSSTEDDLREFLKSCGVIHSLEISTEKPGTATATLDRSSLDAALKLSKEYIGERYVTIREYIPGGSPSKGGGGGEKQDGSTTLFCGNLSFDMNDEAIREFFKDCGDIKAIRWGMDRETEKFKGYGHVEFEDEAGAASAMKLNGKDCLGRAIKLDYARPSERKSGGRGGGGRGGGGGYGGRGGGGGFGGGRGGGGRGGGRGFGGGRGGGRGGGGRGGRY
jgi:nucleolin